MPRPKKFKTAEEKTEHQRKYQKEYYEKMKNNKKRYCSPTTLNNSISRIMTCDKYMIQMLKAMGKAKIETLMKEL